jgi:DnaJ-class molecular chaperone
MVDDRARLICEECGGPARLGRLCEACVDPPGEFVACDRCGGSGEVMVAIIRPFELEPSDHDEACGRCGGTGKIWKAEPRA